MNIKCPLYKAATLMRDSLVEDINVECDKEDCRWWDKEAQQCDPTGLLRWLKRLVEVLDGIGNELKSRPRL